jgi:anhydro-N-acetylmuramic acid kinase
MHTFTEHVALQTGLALINQQGKMLITGGGAYNDFLIGRMHHYLPNLELIIPDAKTLEYKEALIFALLGVLKLRNEINVLSSVTGAKMDHSSGIIY